MTHETIIYGMIDAGELELETLNPHHARNLEILATLPETDASPALVRDMFHVAPAAATHRSQVIHFAGSFESLETQWEAWLDKFEALLRRLYWFGAVIHLDSELFEGDYRYEWVVSDKAFDECLFGDELKPINDWEFTGGPRLFEA
ncbi:hypothetical protein SCOR_17545 [Sulfidibacter corallicola]|uniref:Uncharacterized protein n=1 Tax=Sulfidibacter corallicola TaxID=2818388 RepID=A0A8A4TX11_SULCO|nr:hypothetical protein [Sulfidibacter corallicola]QTD53741.1 hypothetical protein J3U87_14910 [Sulfidibacter corallicola]